MYSVGANPEYTKKRMEMRRKRRARAEAEQEGGGLADGWDSSRSGSKVDL